MSSPATAGPGSPSQAVRAPPHLTTMMTTEDEKKIRRKTVRRALIIFLALVIHFHGVYGLLAIVNDYMLSTAVALSSLLFSISILTAENTLGNILAFDADTSSITSRNGFCCGALDVHLKTCCGLPCYAVLCFHRRVYFARLFYYNMNAFLIAAAWFGIDVCRAIMTQRFVGYDMTGRILLGIGYLIISNAVLVGMHELMAQFGVVGDAAVLESFHDIEVERIEPDIEPNPNYSPMSHHVTVHISSNLAAPLSPPSSPQASIELSWREDLKNRLKAIVAFFALTMYWTSIWDLFCSIPSEILVGSNNDDADDDYYDVHVSGSTDEEFKLLMLGLAYTIVASAYMILTGELFSVVKRFDDRSEMIRRYVSKRFSFELPKDDVVWVGCGFKFYPVRLLSYNLKGAASVIGWAGLSMVMSSFERNAIYNVDFSVERRIVTELMWILIANIILISTNDFGLQYGGSDHLSRRHEVVSIDLGYLPPGQTHQSIGL